MMKKSIFKKLISVVSVLAMVISCTATVFAANDYASQSSDCGDTTNWTVDKVYGGATQGAKQEITNGVLKSERTYFRTTSTNDLATLGITDTAQDAAGEYWYQASEGSWVRVANSNRWSPSGNKYSRYSFADSKTFSNGVVQAKFDFKFEGAARQCISVGFTGSASGSDKYVGLRISRDNVIVLAPKGAPAATTYYFEDKSALVNNAWYTAVLTYDIDKGVVTFKIDSRDDATLDLPLYTYTLISSDWGSYTKGAISGLDFASFAMIDNSVLSATADPASSVWYIDNVSLDAYTETNYALANTYSSGDGVKSNAPATGFTLDGITLTRFTNVVDPANASLITASYDGEGRMIAAQSKSLSQVGADAEDVTVSGNTIKSFILDMNTAKPYINVFTGATPEDKVREIDFDGDDFALNAFNAGDVGVSIANLDASKVHGYGTTEGHSFTVVSEGDNKVLKSERSRTRGSGSVYDWYYDAETNTFKDAGKYTTKNGYYFVRLGEGVTSLKGQFKVKFAGSDHTSGLQEVQVNAASGTSGVGEYFLMFYRKADGSGEARSGWGNTVLSFSANQLKENEWYTVDFTFDGTNLDIDVTGIFGTATSVTTRNGNAMASTMSGKTIDYITIGSPRGRDYAASYAASITNGTATPTVGGRNTSIWYLDDIKLEY